MKRYDHIYYLIADVEREMIPRPSEEEARKAVDDYYNSIAEFYATQALGATEERIKIYKVMMNNKVTLLKLLGVQWKKMNMGVEDV